MLADIAHGHTSWADVLLLVAVVVFGLEFIGGLLTEHVPNVAARVRFFALGWALVALALLLL